ncbi:site-specific integrase, partial [Pseudomonas syringae pv. pisi]
MTVREMLVSPDIGEDVVLGVDRFVTSRLGYELEVFSRSGKLLPMVLLPDDTTRTVYLQLGEINLIRGELGALVKKFITFTLERYHAGTVSA